MVKKVKTPEAAATKGVNKYLKLGHMILGNVSVSVVVRNRDITNF